MTNPDKVPQKGLRAPKRLARVTAILTPTLILSLLVALASCQAPADSATSEENQAPRTLVVEEGTLLIEIDAPASTRPVRSLQIGSQIEGSLNFIAHQGQVFAEGELMASLDPRDLEWTLAQEELRFREAQLNLRRQTENLAQVQATHGQNRVLQQQGLITAEQWAASQSALSQAQYLEESARISLETARMNRDKAQEDLTLSRITAPFDGVVISVEAEAGSRVTKNQSLLVYGDTSQIRVEAEVDEFDIASLALEQPARILFESLGGRPTPFVLDRISPQAEVISNIPVFRVSGLVDNATGRIRPGMQGDMVITVSEATGPLVPYSALLRRQGVWRLQVEGEESPRTVTVATQDGVQAIIAEGLEVGETILLAAPSLPAPGTSSSGTTGTQPPTGSLIPGMAPPTGGMPGGGGGGGGGGIRP